MTERLPFTFAAYRLLTAAATPFAGRLLAYRLRRGKEDPLRLPERRGEPGRERPRGPVVWVHGASVGELVAALPVIERLDERDFTVLVTSGTVTSAAVAARRLPPSAIHQFIPLDLPRYAARFLDYWRPDLALFVESDLWPNLIVAAARRRIPMILVNGRLSKRSYQNWKRAPATIEALLGRFDLCLVRSPEDAERFGALGAPRLGVTGNLKLDVPALPVDPAKLEELRGAIMRRPIVVAASTHPGEERAILVAHRRLRVSFPRLLTIIVPRHPERGAEIAAIAGAAGLEVVRRAGGGLPRAATDVYVCDTLGELGLIYRLAPVVFMGGSLIPHGGQNPIEPIKLGAAVVHGPHVTNFTDIYGVLDQAQGARPVANEAELVNALGTLLADPEERGSVILAAERALHVLAGAVERTMTALEPYLVQIRLGRNDA